MVEWALILIAVNTNNPQDQPARMQFGFETRELCQQTLSTLEYDIKFKSFQVQGQCVEKKSSSSPTTPPTK